MSGTPPYVELHCHSAYSFLDGVSLPEELLQSASELGHEALTLTHRNSVSGSMELALHAESSGVRAIHGAEIDVRAIDDAEGHQAGARRGLADAEGDRAGARRDQGTATRLGDSRHLTLLVRSER